MQGFDIGQTGVAVRGYWRQRADERFGNPPQGGFRSLQWSDTGMEDPQEDPWQCTASVCSGSVLLGDLLGVSRSRELDLLGFSCAYSLCIVA